MSIGQMFSLKGWIFDFFTCFFYNRTTQAYYLILLGVFLLCFTDIVCLNIWSFVATPHWASLSAPFLQKHLLILCHILVILAVFQTFSLQVYLRDIEGSTRTH